MKFNIWRIGSIALLVLLLMTIWYLSQMAESARHNVALLTQEKTVMEKRLSEIAMEKKKAESEISRMKDQVGDIEAKVTDYENKLQTMTAEMTAKDSEVARKNQEIESLKRDIESYTFRIEELDKKLSKKTGWLGGAEKKEEPVTLKPLVITATGKKGTVKVLEVNKNYGFIVINAGSEYGIKKDDVLFVFRNKSMLGRVVVEKVGEGVSIAKILYKELAHTVRKGDLISY